MRSSHPPFLLVIEPSPTLRTILEITLRRHAYLTWALFADPLPALRAIQLGHLPVPDVALVCRRLPYLDGFEVLRILRERQYHTSVVLLLSDQDSRLDRIKARLAGARAVLVKPFTMQELLQVLHTPLLVG